MRLPGSNFVTTTGMVLLALLTLVAAYLRITALEAFLGAILLLCIAAWLWAKASLRNIEIEIEEEDCRAFPGSTMEIGAKLVNRKFLPLIWLKAVFPTGGKTCIAPPPEDIEDCAENEKSQAEIEESFLWVMPHQNISWKQKVLAVHRGVCTVNYLDLSSGDGFGLSSKHRNTPIRGAFRFVVYPEIIPVDISLILKKMTELDKAENGLYYDKTLLKSTREYREGDSFKEINWRLLAKQDDMQINVRETLAMRRVCFVPDVQSFTYEDIIDENGEKKTVTRVKREAMERMFSLIASLIVRLSERGVLCSLVVPAIGDEPARIITPEVREMQVMQLLTALADVDFSGEATRFPEEEIIASHHSIGQLFMLSESLDGKRSAGQENMLEELGVIRIVQVLPEGYDGSDRHIINETEFAAV